MRGDLISFNAQPKAPANLKFGNTLAEWEALLAALKLTAEDAEDAEQECRILNTEYRMMK